jgi:hypothetical protein
MIRVLNGKLSLSLDHYLFPLFSLLMNKLERIFQLLKIVELMYYSHTERNKVVILIIYIIIIFNFNNMAD